MSTSGHDAMLGPGRPGRAPAPARIAPAQLAGFWTRVADLDAEIAATHAEGYCVDGLLDDRLAWQNEREELMERCTGT